MGADGDFNPGFSFDVGCTAAPAQAPWEFGGAGECSSATSSHEMFYSPSSKMEQFVAANSWQHFVP